MTAPYARNQNAPNTQYIQFSPVRHARAGLTGEGGTDWDTGASPISRWLTVAIDYDDFVSNPDATGHIARCQISQNTIVKDLLVRVDEGWAATGKSDIDIGDGNDSDGWADGLDFSSASVIVADASAAYNDKTADPSAGSGGPQYYKDGDTIDVLWKNGTAPTAGKAVVFIKVISYHEAEGAEW